MARYIAALKIVYESALNSNHQFYICVVDGEQIAGFCSLTLKNNLWTQTYLGHINELVVNEAYRDAGLGRKLPARITEPVLENGYKKYSQIVRSIITGRMGIIP